MYDTYNTLLVERKGAVLEVLLNRPDARNAMTYEMENELTEVLNTAKDDDQVKVVTLMGAGKIFSAGHDLKLVARMFTGGGMPEGKDPHPVPHLQSLWYFPKTVIAGVHGYVGPIAQDLIANCDFVIAAEGTRFSFEQARMGAGTGVLLNSPLVFQLPMRVWKKLAMLGGWFTGEQALKWDFVQRVVPEESLADEVRAWAAVAATVPSQQTLAMKQGIHRQYELMGFANMALVQNAISGHGSDIDVDFWQTILDKGLKEALAFRDTQVDEEITRV
jgi:enoyl-CoA hydratase/carnithine racemase